HIRETIFFFETGLDNHVSFVVDDHIQFFRRKTQQVTDLVGQRAEVPDMRHRHLQIDVAHTLTTYFLFCDFYTTTVTHDAFITDTLLFTTVILIVLYRTKDTLTE